MHHEIGVPAPGVLTRVDPMGWPCLPRPIVLLSDPAGADSRLGGTEDGREAEGVDVRDGGGGMSVLRMRVVFFFGCGAVVSAVRDPGRKLVERRV